MRLPVLLVVAGLAALVPASVAEAKPFYCTYNGFTGYDCATNLASYSSGTLVMRWNCGSPRKFVAQDRSKQVDLYARGAWIAPGVVRMRAYGSPLGPLRVVARIKSTRRTTLRNRSAFPVRVWFTITCQYGD